MREGEEKKKERGRVGGRKKERARKSGRSSNREGGKTGHK